MLKIKTTSIGLSPQLVAELMTELRKKRMDYKSISAAAENNSYYSLHKDRVLHWGQDVITRINDAKQ